MTAEFDAVVVAARALLATASRPGSHSATALVSAAALERLRVAAARVTPTGQGQAAEALAEAERRIVEMVSSPYYGGSQEIGARDALIHVRSVLASVTPTGQGQS